MQAFSSIHHSLHASPSEAVQATARCVSEHIQQTIESSVPLLLLVSGGSTIEIFAQLKLPEDCRLITLSVLDERYSEDEKVNNFAQLVRTKVYDEFVSRGGNAIDTRIIAGQTLDQSARLFEKQLRVWRENNPKGGVVNMLGMGIDSHTAGIMPFPENESRFAELFENHDVWVRGYDAGAKNWCPLRFTVTLPFLREQVQTTFLTIIGEEKSHIIHKVLDADISLAAAPISIIKEMREVHIIECAE